MKKRALVFIVIISAVIIALFVLAGIRHAKISYRIDDITFEKSQKQALENALAVAEKYDISFDLAVVAEPFGRNADAETFGIYENNRDRFNIVAHGLTHKNPLNNSNSPDCEFYDDINSIHVPYEIQEEHFREMRGIFERHNISASVFIAPRYAYDSGTKKLAEKYGYKIKGFSNVVYVPMKEKQSWLDISSRKAYLKILSVFKKSVEINLHPVNFEDADDADRLLHGLKK